MPVHLPFAFRKVKLIQQLREIQSTIQSVRAESRAQTTKNVVARFYKKFKFQILKLWNSRCAYLAIFFC